MSIDPNAAATMFAEGYRAGLRFAANHLRETSRTYMASGLTTVGVALGARAAEFARAADEVKPAAEVPG